MTSAMLPRRDSRKGGAEGAVGAVGAEGATETGSTGPDSAAAVTCSCCTAAARTASGGSTMPGVAADAALFGFRSVISVGLDRVVRKAQAPACACDSLLFL